MLTSGISFKNFKKQKKNKKIEKILNKTIEDRNQVIESLSKNYKISYSIGKLQKFKTSKNFRIIGMGGSSLGCQTIYQFLKHKIKKNFVFIDNLQSIKKKRDHKDYTNFIISKSGNTIETILNANIFIKKKDKNIFITENKKSYLFLLAQKLKAEIIHHNNFIGGRYSVLSEVGMLPAELMGLKSNNFKQLNNLIKDKNFLNNLIRNVSATLHYIKNKKYNSIIINYDSNSINIFKWYQQLIAESLGKKGKGIIPLISIGPRDHHSLLQLYLDGPRDNYFYIFSLKEKRQQKKNKELFSDVLNNNNIFEVIKNQKKAMITLLKKKNIPYLSIEISKRNEETLGELFSYFMLETIFIGKHLGINPFNQPAVEQLKKLTTNYLSKKNQK